MNSDISRYGSAPKNETFEDLRAVPDVDLPAAPKHTDKVGCAICGANRSDYNGAMVCEHCDRGICRTSDCETCGGGLRGWLL